jgi:hypothetical protein
MFDTQVPIAGISAAKSAPYAFCIWGIMPFVSRLARLCGGFVKKAKRPSVDHFGFGYFFRLTVGFVIPAWGMFFD